MGSSSSEENDEVKIEDYPIQKKAYDFIENLGRGSFGRVILARINIGEHKNELVAVKILDLDNYHFENWENIEKELSILRVIKHPNLISSLQTFVNESELLLVTPYFDGGSCANLLKKRFPEGIKDETIIATILKETLNGLICLHQDGRIHRNVKAGNILLTREGDVKLTDFGVSRCLMEAGVKTGLARTFTGTPCWMAPEVMQQEKGYDYKADIWSFGITALELGFGRAPYAEYTPMKIILMTLQNKAPSTTNYEGATKFSRSFKNVVDICLKKDAIRRPSAKELLKQKFFKKAKDQNFLKQTLFSDKPRKINLEVNKTLDDKDYNETTKKKAVSVGDFNFEGLKDISTDGKSRFTVEIEE